MITDKLGRLVKCSDRIAIAELKANSTFSKIDSVLSFATVLEVEEDHLKIKYDIGNIDDCFVSKEFILFTEENVYSMIEKATFSLVGL